MSDVTFEISIPLDEEGFIEMECDFCKNRFMLHQEVYKSEDNINFFCPVCGLPNRINTFYCPEVLEKVHQKATNYMYEEIERQLGPLIKKINRSGFIKMTMDRPSREVERELYKPSVNYEMEHCKCCDVDVKVLDFDKEIGVYCPICGGSNL